MIRKKSKYLKKAAVLLFLCLITLSFSACVDYSSSSSKETVSNNAESETNAEENVEATVEENTEENLDANVEENTEDVEANTEDVEANVDQDTEANTEENADAEDIEENNNSKTGELVNTNQSSPIIIATSPATAEICAKLEIPLVGIPHSDTYDIPEVYEGATEVGTAMAPDMEIVSSLNPDWILSPVSLISDLQPKYEAIDTEYAFLNLSSVTGMYKSIQQLGQLFDKEEQAEKLVKEFETFYDEYSANQENKEAPTVLILMGLPGSYVVATPNSYVGNLVELAGGKNVYSDETADFINVNTEDMLEKDPDIILRTAHALPESVMEMFGEEFLINDVWKHFTAVKENKVYDLDYKLFTMSANLQYKEALENLSDIFYGDEQGTNGTEQEG